MTKELEQSAKLLRHCLASIDLSDIEEFKKEEEGMENAEVLGRASDTATYYTNHLKRVLRILINKQIESILVDVQNKDQLNFARGTINGFALIDEWCQSALGIAASKYDNPVKEENDPQAKATPFPEIPEP